jgi:hypothetical protein
MARVLPVVLGRTYNGVGSGALGSRSADFLVPRSAVGESIRSVRLFLKETEADTRLNEASGWCKVGPGAFGLETVCKALELVGRISEESLTRCKPYGQKAKQLETMYMQYIPKERVPPEFASLNLPASAVVPRQATLAADASGVVSVAAPADASLYRITSPAATVLKPAMYNACPPKPRACACISFCCRFARRDFLAGITLTSFMLSSSSLPTTYKTNILLHLPRQ